MQKQMKLTVYGETKKYSENTNLNEISNEYLEKFKYAPIIATVNNEITELFKCAFDGSKVEFWDRSSSIGFRVYQRSTSFLMIYAIKCVLGKKAKIVIEHSVSNNYYCELMGENDEILPITKALLDKIEKVMADTVKKDLPIEKVSLLKNDAAKMSLGFGHFDKAKALKYRRTTYVYMYKIDWFYDYFYGHMAPSTGCLDIFKLVKQDRGFLLQFPSGGEAKINEPKLLKKINAVFRESNGWAKILKADTVGALSEIICSGGQDEFIRVNEALHEKKVANIADMIYKDDKRLVLIAGPSSSGKTTFAERLCIQLRVLGLRPHVISIDNYFNDADTVPLDEFGLPDYESIEHVNSERLNEDLKKLLSGKEIKIPRFNFVTGKSEETGKLLSLQERDILVVEGIHALNEELSRSVAKELKFKIFISALTQLNLDYHNRISTTDTRLIRRIVRDNQFRNYSAASTISIWPSVLRGEARNIYPYQEEADAMFNSALVYELCVLKQFVEPLLFNIEPHMPEYVEAKRLLKFLDAFMGITSEGIPKTSILREFIGGSCFRT